MTLDLENTLNSSKPVTEFVHYLNFNLQANFNVKRGVLAHFLQYQVTHFRMTGEQVPISCKITTDRSYGARKNQTSKCGFYKKRWKLVQEYS